MATQAKESPSSSLPPPPNHLSCTQVDDLLETALLSPSPSSSSTTSSTEPTKLQGRPVLIPLTKYAFIPGQLQPKKDPTTGEEVVVVRPSSSSSNNNNNKDRDKNDVELTTSQAIEWLRQHQEYSKNKKKQTSSTTAKSSNKIHHDGNNKTNHPSAAHAIATDEKTTTRQPQHGTAAAEPEPEPAASFVEIHEEYDASGNPIRTDVIDLNQQLQALWNLHDNDYELLGETKEGQEAPSPHKNSNNHSKNWMDTVLEKSSGGGSGQEASSSTTSSLLQEEAPLKALSDQQYDQLLQRLEELARLEEEQEGRGSGSSARIKGGKTSSSSSKAGWKKGFLNASTKSQPKQPKKNASTTSPGTHPTSSSLSSAKTNIAALPGKRSKIVIDTTQNQVQEIPRIGTQKLPTKTNNAPLSMPSALRPLEESIFSGVVQERPPAIVERPPAVQRTGNKPSRFAASRQQLPTTNIADNSSSSSSSSTKTKRKSRFAQEREGLS